MNEGGEGGGGGSSNDQKLAHFQEVTHLDDFDQCQAILESTNWDLDQAIQSYFSQFSVNESERVDVEATDPVEIDDIIEVAPRPGPFRPFPPPPAVPAAFDHALNSVFNNLSTHQNASFKPKPRLLTFNFKFLSKKFSLYVRDDQTVGKLKELVEEELMIPAKHIRLNGWPTDRFVSDKSLLSELNLTMSTDLVVLNMQTLADDIQNDLANKQGVAFSIGSSSSSAATAATGMPSESDTFELIIKLVQTGDDKINKLMFGRTSTFVEIRRRITSLTGLIANDQEWWYYKPDSRVSDDEQLAELKSINSAERLDQAKNAEKLLGLPLDSIAEDHTTIARIKDLLDELLSSPPDSKATPPAGTSSSSSSRSNKKNKLLFAINNRGPNEPVIVGTNPSTSGLAEQVRKPSLSDYVLVNEGSQPDDYEADDAMMTSTHDEDIDDNFLSQEEPETKQKALITANCPTGNELEGTTMIRDEFLTRYGPVIPFFYLGKLEDAIRDAFVCPARERRLLGIYIHSDNTVFCNIFASKTLCNEAVLNFLTSNFVVWPWDVTLRQHENHLYETLSKLFGSMIAGKLRQQRDKLPLFLIVTRVRSTNEIVAIVEGDSTSDQMIQRLMQCSEMFETQRLSDERDERDRDERERIKREQDQAYRESLENDKAKRQRHAAEEEAKRRLQEKEEAEMKQRVQTSERRKADALVRLGPEPGLDQGQLAKIRFRLPDGATWQRCFRASDRLSSVIDFMTSQGFFPEDYKLLQIYPRRDLTSEPSDKTLEELKLYPQETLTLEQR